MTIYYWSRLCQESVWVIKAQGLGNQHGWPRNYIPNGMTGFRGFMILAYIHMFKCKCYLLRAFLYHLICRHLYVPYTSRHNIIGCNLIAFIIISTDRVWRPKPIYWYLGRPLFMSGWFPQNSDHSMHLSYPMILISFGTYWSILYRLCSNLIVSLRTSNFVVHKLVWHLVILFFPFGSMCLASSSASFCIIWSHSLDVLDYISSPRILPRQWWLIPISYSLSSL